MTTTMTMTLKGNWILGTTIPDLFISSVAGSISYNPNRHENIIIINNNNNDFNQGFIGGRRDDDKVDDDFCR